MKILYVEDEIPHVILTERTLEEYFPDQFELLHAETISATLSLLDANPNIDLILTNLRLPDGSGLDLLNKVNSRKDPPAIVLVTDQVDQENAVAALKAGAADYLVKQSDFLLRLPVSINNAIAHNRLLRERAALREAENKYQSLVEQIPAVVFLNSTDDAETTLYISPRIQELTGYTPEEWQAEPDIRLKSLHPDDHKRIMEAEGRTHRKGLRFQEEYRLIRRDGRVVWVKEDTHLIRDTDGNPYYWQGILLDVTREKENETALHRQVEELSVLHSVATASVESYSEDEVIERITKITGRIYNEVCGVLQLNDKGDTLLPHLSYLGADISKWRQGFPITQGITGRAVSLGKIVRIGDLSKDAEYIQITPDIHSELCIPIRVNERIIGVLNVESKKPDAFDEGDEQFLNTIASSLATALEKLRLFSETERRVQELETINHMSASLRLAPSLDDMLPVLLNKSLDLLNASHGSIWLYDHSTDVLIQKIARGVAGNLKRSSLKPTEGIVGKTFRTGTTYLSPELKSDPLLLEENRDSMAAGFGGIYIPIQSTAGPVGVLVTLIESSRIVTVDELNLLSIQAEIAGNAIHRTELFDQSQEQIRRLTTLRDIDTAIASSTDLRVTLNILTDHAVKHLNVDAVDIMLYRPELQSLTYLCSAGFNTPAPSRSMIRIGEGLAGQVVMKGRTDHIVDLKNSSETKRDPLLLREGFVTYIGVPLVVKGQIKGVFEVFQRSSLSPNAEWMQFLQTLAGQAAIAIDNSHLFDNLQRSNQELTQAYDTTLEGWARALELRDRETEGHTRRVTDLTLRLAHFMGINDEELVNIYRGVLLHDIGKMGVPDQILKKTGPLTASEWQEMRLHPQYAFDLLSPITYLHSALDIPYCHHEHWDGSGYPRGLKGDQIPLSARIFSVVDIWDALLTDRPYRKAWPRDKVLEYIKEVSGTILDPKIVDAFMYLISEGEVETR